MKPEMFFVINKSSDNQPYISLVTESEMAAKGQYEHLVKIGIENSWRPYNQLVKLNEEGLTLLRVNCEGVFGEAQFFDTSELIREYMEPLFQGMDLPPKPASESGPASPENLLKSLIQIERCVGGYSVHNLGTDLNNALDQVRTLKELLSEKVELAIEEAEE